VADLVPFQRVHVVGAGGAGMSGLAKMLAQAGHHVTGSDLKPGPLLSDLAGAGVEVWTGHRPAAMVEVELVIASSAVPEQDPELVAARTAGALIWERPQLLAALTEHLPAIGVTGTHGKTTGSAMAVTVLRGMGRDPSFMVGGRLIALNTNAHLGQRDLFILEADEAFGTFLSLTLGALVVTNIEADHLDHYGTVEAMEAAYAEVAAAVDGPVVGCFDDPGVRRLAATVEGVVGYGTSPDATWWFDGLRREGFGVAATVHGPSGDFPLVVPKPGRHVALNALGIVTLMAELGHDPVGASRALAGFDGVRRRFEVRADRDDLIVVDDYAHHPTEVAATIAAARSGHDGRVVAVFQPHRYSRTAELGAALGEALSAADRVIVADVYAAGEVPIPGVTGRTVADAVDGPQTDFIHRRVDLAPAVAGLLEPGDLVLTLGAGDVTGVPDELLALLPEA
jgi:UDP-N-acetylmuramate--alanine ligase